MSDFDPIDFLEQAVATPSNESVDEMRDLLVSTLEANGADTRVDDAGNTLASRGTGEPHVVLNTHIDTVGPHVPFERDGDVIRGRGSCDAKGPLAAFLDAFFRTNGHVTLAITPDEETISTGAAALDLDALAADAYIVGEPTGLDACTAAKGRFEAVITLGGSNAHAAEAAQGVNAVDAAARVLDAIRTFDANRGPAEHPTLGPPLLTPTIIRGGETANQVPDECSITVDRRTVPPETAAEFRESLEVHLRAAVPEEVALTVDLAERETPYLEAFATDQDEPVVRRLVEAGGGVARPFSAATEASYFAEDAPTVVFGPGVLADENGAVAHADREYVRTPDVRMAADAVVETIDSLADTG